jgi:hypothetical protein
MESYGEWFAAIKRRQGQVAVEIDLAMLRARQQIDAAEDLLDRVATIRTGRARRDAA